MKQFLMILILFMTDVNLYGQIDSVFSKKPLDEKINIIKFELISDTISFKRVIYIMV